VPFREAEHQFASIGCEMRPSFFEHGGSGGTAITIDDDAFDPFGDGDESKAFDAAHAAGRKVSITLSDS